MDQIAVKLDNTTIIGVVVGRAVSKYESEKGWRLVENDPMFSVDSVSAWTVREPDSKLVHKSTGKTPDEETKDTIKILTESQLTSKLTNDQVQQAFKAMTTQIIQDKLTAQTAITALTKQVADLTIKLDRANGVDSAPEAPTNVTSTATNDGAVVTAK